MEKVAIASYDPGEEEGRLKSPPSGKPIVLSFPPADDDSLHKPDIEEKDTDHTPASEHVNKPTLPPAPLRKMFQYVWARCFITVD